MKKSVGVIIAIVVIIVVIVGVFVLVGTNGSKTSNLGNLSEFVNKLYADVTLELPMLQTNEIDVTDTDTVQNFTAIGDTSVVEELVVSEPLMTSQAYSMVILKVKNGTNVEAIKTEMKENLEKLYINNSGNYIFAIMTSEEYAKGMYDQFKKQVDGNVGTLVQKDAEVFDFEDTTPENQEAVSVY